ncbi:MAG: cytochrome d ubiquinol oxidase subunit II [Bacteroidales bacterium]|nr:cytochrome d ubiquinol oxidase subunit II [Bacteroidales bacterium]MDG2080601.1 cytochrome d ubiquinol oxidase subunit II [Bacteroidales bacterium]
METFLNIDYPTLWFLVVGAVFSGYAILDGFDLGAGSLHLFLKTDKDRRIALNAVGPVWDGNEVWLVIGGGTLFAGFPVLYATLLSAMYIPFMLFLLFIILRAIAIEFRSKEEMKWWRNIWDFIYSLSSIMLAICLGIVLGNVLQGMPLDENYEYQGDWLSFFNFYSLLVGLTTLALMSLHGGLYLCIKTEGKLFDRVRLLLRYALILFVIFFGILSIYSLFYFPHLSDKFSNTPLFYLVPVMAVLSIANIPRLINKRKFISAFIFSAITFSLLLIIVAIELYPKLIFATNNIDNSITIYNAASSDKSIGIMLTFVAIGVPLIIGYTYFVYKAFWGKVKIDETSY